MGEFLAVSLAPVTDRIRLVGGQRRICEHGNLLAI
jgi:hypothetical protein